MCIVFQDTCSQNGLCVEDIKAGVADAPVEPPPDIPPVIQLLTPGRSLQSSSFQLSVSTFSGIRWVMSVTKSAQVEPKTGQVLAPPARARRRRHRHRHRAHGRGVIENYTCRP